ncbi:unnamed protein product [Rotaria sp. Silwood2]|nr:unnamed protein product [Rotaria sp. Silwood2]CAF2974680.1 unnamed protein product [Rotaria sp. Silwood2]CAF4018390.1 unnamed protein product [Rotaria sp. Silwood2]CAF4114968.1 unnamed protein product [Rotaria sp. Silwood2]CAF4573491.1 unnamed protein product [Rotaria sp. Silwood2]
MRLLLLTFFSTLPLIFNCEAHTEHFFYNNKKLRATIDVHLTDKYKTSIEGGDIDRDRIVDGHLLPDEYFCPICRCLLWNPRSCASCQHLFC